METLNFSFPTRNTQISGNQSILVGVVSSGNLEVMVEKTESSELCEIEVVTSAKGFNSTWQAVLSDFVARSQISGVKISINDMGATPATVSLRLDQAHAEFQEVCNDQ